MALRGFLSELGRRNVFRVAAAYLVCAWLLIQVAEVVFPALLLPEWGVRLVVALLAIGFAPALICAWVWEITPEGIRRESPAGTSSAKAGEAGRRLDLITVAMLLLGIGMLLLDQFVLDRRVEGPTAGQHEAGRRTQGSATDVDAVPFVAVLPFKVIGSDAGGFLASGLHDDLLTRLAKLGAFGVISRTSVLEYAETPRNMRQIAGELGVSHVLEGTVQSLGNQVHINAQLIDAREDKHLWADSFDRELTATNLFEIQAELALAIATQLQITLSDSARMLIRNTPTENTAAYNAYLQGLELSEKPYSADNQSATEAAFEAAVQLDPGFPQAWARLSMARSRAALYTTDADSRRRSLQGALTAHDKAQALQPDLLETVLAQAYYLYVSSDYGQSLEILETLGERGEMSVEPLEQKGWLYLRIGRFEDAYRTLLQAQRLAPRSHTIAYRLVQAAIFINDCEAANWHTQTALSLAPGDADVLANAADFELQCTGNARRARELLRGADLDKGNVLDVARDVARALRDYPLLLELSRLPVSGPYPMLPINDLFDQYDALSHLGRAEEAAATLRAAGDGLAALERDGAADGDPWYPLTKSRYYSLRGDVAQTLRWIDEDRRRAREGQGLQVAEQQAASLVRAINFTNVGLHDEALEELQAMLERSGGFTFRFVDAMPFFDPLRDLHGYQLLRERYAGTPPRR